MTVNPKSTKFTQCEAYTTGNGNNSSIGVLEVFRYWQIIPLAQLVFACIQTIFPPTNSLRNTLTPTPPPTPPSVSTVSYFRWKANRILGYSFSPTVLQTNLFLIMYKLGLVFISTDECFL